MAELSTSFVDKYLQRIRENRELKNATIITSAEGKVELDASKIVFIPSTIEGAVAVGINEENHALNYDYGINETITEMISRKNSFTLNCTVAEGLPDGHVCTSNNLTYAYDDYNPAIQKGVYVPLNRKKEDPIVMLSNIAK